MREVEIWEVTLLVDGDRQITQETVTRPMAQANAEVKAIKRAESNGAGNVRVLHSRYLGELRDEE